MPRAASPLDLFFHPREPLDVLRAVRALGELSQGEVVSDGTFGRTGRPTRGGVFCACLFGPVEDGRCNCGYLGAPQGREPEDESERCPKCGVEARSSAVRCERWAHIASSVPLLHPACVPMVAELTGFSAKEIREALAPVSFDRADGEVGVPRQVRHSASDLRELLARARGPLVDTLAQAGFHPSKLLVDRVPVTPPGDRPLVRMPGGHDMPSARSLAFIALVHRTRRAGRLAELAAPEVILRNEAALTQQAFERVCDSQIDGAVWVAEGDDEVEAGRPLPARDPSNLADEMAFVPDDHDPTRPIAAAIVDMSSVLVQYPYALVHLGLDGRVLDVVDVAGFRLIAVDARGEQALLQGSLGFAVRDLPRRAWETTVPEAFPAVTTAEDHETLFLVDARRNRSLLLTDLGDYPMFAVFSPDAAHVWAEDKEGGGGIYGAASGMRELHRTDEGGNAAEARRLTRDGRIEDASEDEHEAGEQEDEDRYPEDPTLCAVVLTSWDRFRLTDGRRVWEDGESLLTLATPAPVEAFSPRGDALLVVRRERATLVDLPRGGAPSVRANLALGGIVATLRARREAAADAS